jgi:hypothetical protein
MNIDLKKFGFKKINDKAVKQFNKIIDECNNNKDSLFFGFFIMAHSDENGNLTGAGNMGFSMLDDDSTEFLKNEFMKTIDNHIANKLGDLLENEAVENS